MRAPHRLLGTLVLMAMVLSGSIRAQQWNGFPAPLFKVGTGIRSVATGDFNEDGIVDLVAANETSDNVSVLLGAGHDGNGIGLFESSVNYPSGDGPTYVASGDFNEDGITDLAVSNRNGDNVSVLIGNGGGGVGDGTFAAAVTYNAGDEPLSLVTGDFNEDDILDLAVADLTGDTISILLGNGTSGVGDGTFASAIGFAAGDGPVSIASGDFDEDGITDLAVGNSVASSISILIGNGSAGVGDGTFSTPVSYPAGTGTQGVTSGDFNEDGITDLAAANSTSGNVSILLGNGGGGVGDGTFGTAVNYPTASGSDDIVAVDFNEDGILDLATVNLSSNSVSILPGNGTLGVGDGTFGTAANFGAQKQPLAMAVADFNEDGIADITTANLLTNSVQVFLGRGSAGVGDGTFQTNAVAPVGDGPFTINSGDFDEDGILDLVTANSNSDNLSILVGNGTSGVGDGTFTTAVNYGAGDSPFAVTTGDFNEDGITDLATANGNSDNVSILIGNGTSGVGDGTFAAAVNYAAADGPRSILSSDFNEDGIADIATANINSGNLSVLIGNGTSGVGDGTFAAPVNYAAGSGANLVATADFNEDGIADIAVANLNADNVSVLIGNGSAGVGDGTFAAAVNYPTGDGPRGLGIADFNEDGIADIFTAQQGSNDIAVLLGNGTSGVGDGTFAAPVAYPTDAIGTRIVAASDFNNDGILDLAAANTSTDTATVLLGDGSAGVGDGTFQTASNFGTDSGSTGVVAGDFNEDGFPDAATANFTADTVSILLNRGLADVTDPVSAATGPTGSLTQPSPIMSVTYGASDTHAGSTGVASVQLFYQRDGGGYTSYGTFTASPISFDTSSTGGDGTYDFYTIATDNANNVESKIATAETSVIFNDNTSVVDWNLVNR